MVTKSDHSCYFRCGGFVTSPMENWINLYFPFFLFSQIMSCIQFSPVALSPPDSTMDYQTRCYRVSWITAILCNIHHSDILYKGHDCDIEMSSRLIMLQKHCIIAIMNLLSQKLLLIMIYFNTSYFPKQAKRLP